MNAIIFSKNKNIQLSIEFFIENYFNINYHILKTIEDCISFLETNKEEIDAVFCEFDEETKKLMLYCSDKKKSVHFFCEYNSIDKDQISIDQKEWVHFFDKSKITEDLSVKILEVFKEYKNLKKVDECEFLKIRLDFIFLCILSPCDVYLKLSEKKYVKIFNEGYKVEASDVEHFSKNKQVSELYFKKKELSKFSNVFETNFKNLSSASPVDSSDLKKKKIANQIEKALTSDLDVIQGMSLRFGFTEEVQKVTKKRVETAIQTIRSVSKLSSLLLSLRKDKEKYIASHSMLLGYISCAIASQMEWNSETTYQKLTLASFLHDITLKNKEIAKIQSLSELERQKDQFSLEDLNAYYEHPNAAAELARQFHEVPPDVDSIIAQHHERPDGSGFPRRLIHSRIGPLSSVFIVAHDLVSCIFQNNVFESNELKIDEFIKKNILIYSVSNFRKVIFALKKIKY